MTTLPDSIELTEGDAGLVVTRRRPPRGAWWRGAGFALAGVLFAVEPGFALSDFAGLVLATTLTALTLADRAQVVAQSPLVRRLRGRLVVATDRAASGYREGGGAPAVSVDGRERPRADLRRVAVGRKLVVEIQQDRSVQDVPRAATVALIFDDEAVVVDRAESVDAAQALAARIAGAAGLTADWLADVFTGVGNRRLGTRRYGSALLRDAQAVDNLVEALPMQALQSRVTLRYGTHLSVLRRMATVLFASVVVLASMAGVIGVEDGAFALTAVGRWASAAMALAVCFAADAVAVYGTVAIVRDAARARAREVYGIR